MQQVRTHVVLVAVIKLLSQGGFTHATAASIYFSVDLFVFLSACHLCPIAVAVPRSAAATGYPMFPARDPRDMVAAVAYP